MPGFSQVKRGVGASRRQGLNRKRLWARAPRFHRLREPGKPVPREITALTGIDDAMVAGQTLDPAEVASFAAPAALMIAHNASFDRRFLERFSDTFSIKPWACSMSQIDWADEGREGVSSPIC
jgi:DNA polymerase-3 subunit epsilon